MNQHKSISYYFVIILNNQEFGNQYEQACAINPHRNEGSY